MFWLWKLQHFYQMNTIQCTVHNVYHHSYAFIPRKVSTHSWFSKWANLISHSIKYKSHTHNNHIKRIFCWMSNRYIDKVPCQINVTKSERMPHIFAHFWIDGSPMVERNWSIQKFLCIYLSFWWDAFILSHHSTSQLVNLSSGEWLVLVSFVFLCFDRLLKVSVLFAIHFIPSSQSILVYVYPISIGFLFRCWKNRNYINETQMTHRIYCIFFSFW